MSITQRSRDARFTAAPHRRAKTYAQPGIYHAALAGFHHNDYPRVGREIYNCGDAIDHNAVGATPLNTRWHKRQWRALLQERQIAATVDGCWYLEGININRFFNFTQF